MFHSIYGLLINKIENNNVFILRANRVFYLK